MNGLICKISIFQVSLQPIQVLGQGAEEEKGEIARLVSIEYNILLIFIYLFKYLIKPRFHIFFECSFFC